MTSPFSPVFFDLDGVIVDSAAAMTRAVDATLESVGAASAPPEMQRLLFGPPLYVGFASLLEAIGADRSLNKRCGDLYRQHYQDFVVSESRIYDGMQDVLEHLLPLTPMVVATSKPREFALLLLEALGLVSYFAEIAAPASEADMEPKATTIARALLNREHPAAVHVGDTAADVLAAKTNHIPCAAAL